MCRSAPPPQEVTLDHTDPGPQRRAFASASATAAKAAERTLLDATVSILVERGLAAITTLEVQKQSGLSRGVLLHYWGSRGELISAAARHLYASKVDEARLRACSTHGDGCPTSTSPRG